MYVYEQAYRVPGTDVERTQRGFFARLRLEPFGPGSGVLPHERTLSGPKEDRYKLLRATGINTSPVVGLFEDPSGRAAAMLAAAVLEPPLADVVDDDGVRHRLWLVTDEGDDAAATTLATIAGSGPVFIADGHHRYETAIRYRDERRMTRSCEEDPAFDYLLMLFLDAADQLTVLPTHRVVRGLGDAGLAHLRDRARAPVRGHAASTPARSSRGSRPPASCAGRGTVRARDAGRRRGSSRRGATRSPASSPTAATPCAPST